MIHALWSHGSKKKKKKKKKIIGRGIFISEAKPASVVNYTYWLMEREAY